jgi:HD-GYP domain-containing protein (c-di-GMP phosphodiesterase class II)
MLRKTLLRLENRLKDTQLKEVLISELKAAIADKPEDVSEDEFMSAAAAVLLYDLKMRMGQSKATAAPARIADIQPSDCSQIITRLVQEMQRDLQQCNLQMIHALGCAIAERDSGTAEHNFRVTIYAVRLAERMKLPKQEIQSIIKGSYVHDIGKIGIRDGTLLKRGYLSPDEYEYIKEHVLLGVKIIKDVVWLEDAIDIVLYHHERWNGSGYLRGLRGTDIPLNARVFAIADVFDSLTSKRPYKEALPFDVAYSALKNGREVLFDPELLDNFLIIVGDVYGDISRKPYDQLETDTRKLTGTYFDVNRAS